MRGLVILGGTCGFLGVALGAFGAHALQSRISPGMLAVYHTGVQYHLIHALTLLFVALLADRWPRNRLLPWCGRLFGTGILLFSGSLYLLAVTGIRIMGAITPLGGLCLLAGWALLGLAAVQETER